MRWLLSLAFLGFMLPGARALQDQEAELRRKVEEVLRRETERSRAELLEVVRRELRGGGAPAAGAGVTAGLLRGHVEVLAGDALEGRNAGYPGEQKAAEYIAGVMKEAGLRPAGDDGTFFQKFRAGRRETRNVVGLLEGTDPGLREEYVVVGAHHDHVGTADQGHWGRLGKARGDDTIYNGADDNASGTAIVLGLARAFGAGEIRTRRSMVFITFSGEEGGLLGSRHYVGRPVAPIAQHVFMLNLDMVGRNPGRPVDVHGTGSAEGGVLRKAAGAAFDRAGLKARIHDSAQLMMGDSDHSSFAARRVPFVFFFTGFHPDYHRVTDHADKLAYDNMAGIARAAFHLLSEVADADARPRFSGAGMASPFRLPDFDLPLRPARRLGVTVQELDGAECDALGLEGDQGALRVEDVHAGTAAEGAGMRRGDVLLGIAGAPLPRSGPRERLRRALADEIRPGREYELLVLRDGQRLTLKAKWAEDSP